MTQFSSITDRITQLTFLQKILLAIAGMVFLGALLSFVLLLPRWNESKELRADIDREKIKLVQIIQTRSQISRFKKELAEMDVLYKQLVVMLPEAKEIPHLLKNVANIGQQLGLEFLLVKPGLEDPKEYVAEIPLTLHLKGSYHQIGVFFDQIRRLPRIINIKQLELGTFDEKTTQIIARCQMVTFRILPPPPPSSTPIRKAGKKK
ncbi:MAG: hypothetical protein A2Y79_03675 [Deltaproteobacteria bacterium RBG_13_43_22]|nr:MAG: hypothetical protein A2Y79_03675 [Deltaproteobacteria bacterium RBG_13_43_22]